MAIDSVPPSVDIRQLYWESEERYLTRKCSRYENGCKATDTSHKRCIANEPIVAANILMVSISATIHSNSQDYEDLYDETVSSEKLISCGIIQ